MKESKQKSFLLYLIQYKKNLYKPNFWRNWLQSVRYLQLFCLRSTSTVSASLIIHQKKFCIMKVFPEISGHQITSVPLVTIKVNLPADPGSAGISLFK
jgi:hypothetical protein